MTDYQVIWRGHVSYAGGLGTACREYILALKRLGVDVKIDSYTTNIPESDQKKVKELRNLMNKPYAHGKTKILVYHNHPYNIDVKKERKKFDYVLLNTVWETTKVPNSWFPTINQFNAVFVPSRQNVEALKNSGVYRPIYHVPHGAETKYFNPWNKKLHLKGAKGKFVFISVFDFQHRKNPEGLLRAYWEEFSRNENVMLVVKTYWSGHKNMEGHIREKILKYKQQLRLKHDTAPLILITKTIKKKEMKGLYTLGNAFVLPSRGEGVGLPFIEALSSGTPVIATGWGGQMDFLNSSNSFLVDYKLERPSVSMNKAISREFRYLFNDYGQLWAEPSIQSLRRQMRYAYQNPLLCEQKGKHGREDMLKMSWDRAGMILKKTIESAIK